MLPLLFNTFPFMVAFLLHPQITFKSCQLPETRTWQNRTTGGRFTHPHTALTTFLIRMQGPGRPPPDALSRGEREVGCEMKWLSCRAGWEHVLNNHDHIRWSTSRGLGTAGGAYSFPAMAHSEAGKGGRKKCIEMHEMTFTIKRVGSVGWFIVAHKPFCWSSPKTSWPTPGLQANLVIS